MISTASQLSGAPSFPALVMGNTSLYRGLGPLIRSRWVVVTQADKGRTKLVRLTTKGQRVTKPSSQGRTSPDPP
jgi:hypothetical protein